MEVRVIRDQSNPSTYVYRCVIEKSIHSHQVAIPQSFKTTIVFYYDAFFLTKKNEINLLTLEHVVIV